MTVHQTQQRYHWAAARRALEKKPVKKGLFEGHGIKIDSLVKAAAACIKNTPLFARGYQNAAYPKLIRRTLSFPHLPRAFDGYTILHLTDLHLDCVPEITGRAVRIIRRLQKETIPDICLITGDYIDRHARRDYLSVISPLREIVSAVKTKDGSYAVLGNHDTWKMVLPIEAMGVRMLINETCMIRRQGACLALTGLDDPNHYLTPGAVRALEGVAADFKIALVHTAELYEEAACNGFDFYLTGHTHGGQISLPGGKPVLLPMKKAKQFYRGVWRYKDMTGYTSLGLGAISIPIRFNTHSEMTLIRLERSNG